MSKQEVETDFNAEFLARMLPRLEWPAVLEGAKAVRSTNYSLQHIRIAFDFTILSSFCNNLDWMCRYIAHRTTTTARR